MPEGSRTHMGGTMRLGLRPTVFEPETGLDETAKRSRSKIRMLYGGAEKIWERHRHRYEVSPKYVERLEESGMKFVGKDEKGERMQVMELDGKFFFVREGKERYTSFFLSFLLFFRVECYCY